MKKIAFIVMLHFIAALTYADTIVLKDGRKLNVEGTWEKDGKIMCVMYGSVVGFPKEDVLRVVTPSPTEPKREPVPTQTKTISNKKTGIRPSAKPDLSPSEIFSRMLVRSKALATEVTGLHKSRWFGKRISESELIVRMQRLCPEIRDIYMRHGDLPRILSRKNDQVVGNIFALMDNICLYYSPKGLKTWSERDREINIKMEFKNIVEEVRRISRKEP